jgi:hypothetical protein
MSDVRIQEVATDIVITEPVGPLSADDVKRIVTQALQILREEQERAAQRGKDTKVRGSSADASGE